MAAPAQTVAQNLADAGHDITPIALWPESGEWLAGEWIGRIDRELLGFGSGALMHGGWCAPKPCRPRCGSSRADALPAAGHNIGDCFVAALLAMTTTHDVIASAAKQSRRRVAGPSV